MRCVVMYLVFSILAYVLFLYPLSVVAKESDERKYEEESI